MRQLKLLGLLATTAASLLFANPAAAEMMRVTWYGPRYHGNRTASGEVFNRWAYTAAHPSWPFGTKVRVTDPDTGRSVVLRINDRSRHNLDISEKAASDLGIRRQGVAALEVRVLSWGN